MLVLAEARPVAAAGGRAVAGRAQAQERLGAEPAWWLWEREVCSTENVTLCLKHFQWS